jgi:hypothetical protein
LVLFLEAAGENPMEYSFGTPVTRLPDHNKNPEGLASLMEVSRKPVSMPCNAVTGNKD